MNHKPYSCPNCTASCTFEAMQWCNTTAQECPVLQDLASGKIVDRRPDDKAPNFPSTFTLAKPKND